MHLVLVGNETLLGKELDEVLKQRIPDVQIAYFAASGEGGFGEGHEEGEAVYQGPLDAPSLKRADVVVFAGSAVGAAKLYELARAAGKGVKLIDCTGFLEEQPEARISGTAINPSGAAKLPPVSKIRTGLAGRLIIVPHPAAILIVTALKRLAMHGTVRQIVAHIFEPASERGRRGVNELHQQTMGILSFKPLEKAVFDDQLSFNLLPGYGEDAPLQLAAIEQRIEKHVASLLSQDKGVKSKAVPIPSIRLVQVPVFHGYSASLWVEFDKSVERVSLEEALASAEVEVRRGGEEFPTSVGATGQSGLSVGDVRVDPNNGKAAWVWVVADNLRLTAEAAADLLTEESGVMVQ